MIIDNDNTKSDNKRDNEDKIIDRIVSENGDNIINVNENERENENIVYIDVRVRYNSIISIKNDRSCKTDDIKNFENIVYRDERGRLCAATPASIIDNRTPPSPSQKHHFTHKHQINFCNWDYHHINILSVATSAAGKDAAISAQLNICNYGTSYCKPD